MNPAKEKKILQFLLQLIAARGKIQHMSRWRKQLTGICIGLALAPVSWALFIEPAAYKFILFFLCFGAGVGVNVFTRRVRAEREWPMLVPYLDRSRVQARLDELDA